MSSQFPLTRRQFVAAGAAATLNGQPVQPNVIVILTDDMGYGDIGPYGVRDTKTPSLDRLAREGVRFVNSYANAPVCTPTRCGLMTGRYQQRAGLEWALLPDHTEHGLATAAPSLPRMLRSSGYRTAMFGKWHLGWKPEFGPIAHGFEEFFGLLGGNADLYQHRNVNGRPDLWENTEPAKKEGYLTDLLTDRAVRYVENQAARPSREPFFLYVAYNAVHWPFQPPGRPDARTRENWMHGSRADYVKMVENVDQNVGRILDALDRKKLTGETLVIFTNDNGGERFSRNEPFFHHKATLWEGGVRVPTLMRWPGRVPSGATSRQTMITMDLTATILAAARAKTPAGYAPEGIDLLPILNRTKPEIPRTLFWRIHRDDRKQRSVRQSNLKYIRDGNIEMLFDLEKDPGERVDIAPSHPEKLTELRKAVAAWEQDVDRDAPSAVIR
jgi:arylsulfatase A-like enzyme